MAYTRNPAWVDDAEPDIMAAPLNHIEAGLETAANVADNAETKANQALSGIAAVDSKAEQAMQTAGGVAGALVGVDTKASNASTTADTALSAAIEATTTAQQAKGSAAALATTVTQLENTVNGLLTRIAALENANGGGSQFQEPYFNPDSFGLGVNRNQPYEYTFTADPVGTDETDYDFTLLNAPINGLSLTKIDALNTKISGTPTNAGTSYFDFNITAHVSDGSTRSYQMHLSFNLS